MGLLLSEPQAAAAGAARAMAHWYTSVAPAVFPFLALMPLLTCSEAAMVYERLLGRITGALFDLPGAAAPAMVVGMVAGTPAGAIAARSIAARAGMNRGQLQRTAISTMGFSPAFLISGIGVGMLGSAEWGWRLACAQLMTQLTLAMLLRRAWRNRTQAVSEAGSFHAEAPVRAAVLAALTICGYMALFGALTGVVGTYLGQGVSNMFLCLLDVPSGARMISESSVAMEPRAVMLAAMCGFSGVCLIAQSMSALRDCGLKMTECFALRVLAGAVSAGYMALLLKLDNSSIPDFISAARVNPMAAAGLCASLMAIPALIKMKKFIS